ncbi:MAG: PilZ domain-containing protein [Thermodesulfobacteriota bacterium]
MALNRKKHIVIAEESEYIREKLHTAMVDSGFKVSPAESTIDVIGLVKDSVGTIDFLMLDMDLPPQGAIWLLKWLDRNDLRGEFPIMVLLENEELEANRDELKIQGASYLMEKGFSIEQIIAHMNQILNKGKWEKGAPRVPISIPIEYSGEESSGNSHMLNLSENGIFLYTSDELEPGEVLELKFTLPETGKEIKTRGEVIRESKLRGTDALYSGYGVTFTFLSDEHKKLIDDFLTTQLN